MATAIEFENVGKQYRLGLVSTRTLSHDLERWWTMNILHKEDPYLTIGETNDRATKGQSEYVWALRDINFKVEQGDVVGIIGRNGAGKSTLLKLLSKVTGPSTGCIRARGRIGSLLEVGTGFHGEMTGRENIFMNGAILGMTKPEIARKLDEIVDFSGCERYIDTPVKRYSSGMTVRLGFAVAAFLDPEILVVDEVLAVGDAEFQKKAIGKMQDVSQGEGRTVLFVSHNMASIRKLCHTGLLLENGKVKTTGLIEDVVDAYLASSYSQIGTDLKDRTDRRGSGEVKITGLTMFSNGCQRNNISMGKGADFVIEIDSPKEVNQVFVGISIWNESEVIITHTNTSFSMGHTIDLHSGINKIKCSFPYLPIQFGNYYLNLAVYNDQNVFIDQIEHAFSFSVVEDDCFGTGKLAERHQGFLVVENKWEIMQ